MAVLKLVDIMTQNFEVLVLIVKDWSYCIWVYYVDDVKQ